MTKVKHRFPSVANLKSISKKLEKEKGSFILSANADAVDRAKYEICKHILIYMHTKELNQRSLAKLIGVPETRVSEIVHYRIWKFTLDRLLSYFEKLKPNVVLKVA